MTILGCPLSVNTTQSKLEKHTKTKCLVQSEAGFQASLFENLSMFNMSTHHCSIIYVIENKEKHNRSTLIVVSTCLCITLIWQLTIRAHSWVMKDHVKIDDLVNFW